MDKLVWAPNQSDLFREVEEGQGNIAVCARAGAGKTTAIEECFLRIPKTARAFALAFGKSIQVELAARIQKRGIRNVEARTFHSLGFEAIRKAFGRGVPGGIQMHDHKVNDLLRELRAPTLPGRVPMFPDLNRNGWNDLHRVTSKLVHFAKDSLASTQEDLYRLIDHYDLDVSEWIDEDVDRARDMVVALCVQTLTLCKEFTSFIDQDDMTWFPEVFKLPLPQTDFVFVDEVQDLNAAQIEMMLRVTRPGGRTVVVGDDRQAIYNFRGADERAFDRVVEALDAKVMSLSITYRCPKAVVRLANQFVPDLEAAPNAEEGLVEQTTMSNLLNNAQSGDFVLSRTNAPLVALCMRFLSDGRRAIILGRDVGESLAKMVKRSRATTTVALATWIEEWRTREVERLRRAKNEASIGIVCDKAEVLLAIAADCETIAEVRTKLATLFSKKEDGDDEDNDAIVLSTTHKAKGLERDTVWLLRETYLRYPSVEEENLLYVAITRARKTLRIVTKQGNRDD